MIGIRLFAAATALAVVGVTGSAGMAYAGDYSSSDNSGDHHHHCGDHEAFYHFDHDGLLGDLLGFGQRSRYDHGCSDRDNGSDLDNGSNFGGFDGFDGSDL